MERYNNHVYKQMLLGTSLQGLIHTSPFWPGGP